MKVIKTYKKNGNYYLKVLFIKPIVITGKEYASLNNIIRRLELA